jgi:hypothetical protein
VGKARSGRPQAVSLRIKELFYWEMEIWILLFFFSCSAHKNQFFLSCRFCLVELRFELKAWAMPPVHFALVIFRDGSLMNYLPRLDLNCYPPDLSLLSS